MDRGWLPIIIRHAHVASGEDGVIMSSPGSALSLHGLRGPVSWEDGLVSWDRGGRWFVVGPSVAF